jgi:serine protease Do
LIFYKYIMKGLLLGLILFSTIICSTTLGLFAGVVGSRLNHNSDSNFQVINQQDAIVNAVNKASDSVVSIVVYQKQSDLLNSRRIPLEYFFIRPDSLPRNDEPSEELIPVAGGSGFVVSSDGLIITNRHVVDEESATYSVVFKSGEEYDAKVLAKDTLLDIAFLKIETTNLKPLDFGDSSKIQVGQSAIAIGNALGEYSNSVSAGIISGLGRSITARDSFSNSSEQLYNVIQTDASINTGNSGGPLLDINGKVIGVNVAVATDAQGIGFAIPSNVVVDLIDRLQTDGEIIRPRLGVRFKMITKSIKNDLNLNVDSGALIVKGDNSDEPAIVEKSAAQIAGLIEDDIITKVNSEELSINNPLNIVIQQYKVGDTVNLTVIREDKTLNIKATLTQ